MKYIPLVFRKDFSAQVLKANMKIVGNCEYGLLLYRDKLPKFNNDGRMIFNCFDWVRDNDTPKVHSAQKPVPLLRKMKHLQELGFDTGDASMHYQFLPTADSIINGTDEVEKEPSLFVSQPNMKHEYPTYTLQDIMQKLPPSINICMLHIYKAADLWYFVYMDSYTRTIISTQYSPDIMSAAYQMLCWVIENGYLETNK